MPLMLSLFRLLAVLALLCVPLVGVVADDHGKVLQPLQGQWTVIAGEHGGQPFDAMNGGIMSIQADRFRIDTSAGNKLEGSLALDDSVAPAQMVMAHDSGLEWRAIYAVSESDLRLNYIDAAGPDPLPSAFRTSPDTEATVVVLKRQQTE